MVAKVESSGSSAITGLSLSVICSHASRAAMPYKSVDMDAAVGDVLATLSVAVSEMCTCHDGPVRGRADVIYNRADEHVRRKKCCHAHGHLCMTILC